MKERHKQLLIKQNPHWQNKKVSLPKFERDLIKVLEKYVNYKQILAVVGLRRVGKTILFKQFLQKLKQKPENLCYISFDDIDFQDYETAEELINYFLEFSIKTQQRYLFLDEIQKLPNWADLLKTYYDIEENLKIFISGSASLDIKEHKETLAGRILSFHLPVLTFSEFLRFFDMKSEISFETLFRDYDLNFSQFKEKYKLIFESYIFKGAFPELLDINDDEFVRKYINESVIEKTVSDIARVSKQDDKVIFELFRLLTNSNAQLFEINNLANLLGINRNLVSKYINLLEKSFLIKIAYNYTTSVAKQVRTSKKQFIAHSSIVISLLNYPREIINTNLSGHLIEAAIATQLEKISFWRTPYKDEVDIVVNQHKTVYPIEIKYQSQISKNDLKSLIKFCKHFKIKTGYVITKDLMDKQNIKGVDIIFIPAWVFLMSSWIK